MWINQTCFDSQPNLNSCCSQVLLCYFFFNALKKFLGLTQCKVFLCCQNTTSNCREMATATNRSRILKQRKIIFILYVFEAFITGDLKSSHWLLFWDTLIKTLVSFGLDQVLQNSVICRMMCSDKIWDHCWRKCYQWAFILVHDSRTNLLQKCCVKLFCFPSQTDILWTGLYI